MMRSSNYRNGESLNPRCIILAAGTSTRLRPLTANKPKCLLEIGGKTLLERTIQNVRLAGIRSIAIVVGFEGEKIREFIGRRFAGMKFHFIFNADYAETNNAYSLWLARPFAGGSNFKRGLLLLDSDILFSSKLLHCLLNEAPDDASARRRARNLADTDGIIAVRGKGRHDSEEMRVSVDGNSLITAIGKDIQAAKSFGESIGIEILSARAVEKLFGILRERMKTANGKTEFYEASFQRMMEEGSTLRALDVSAFPAVEIDTPADLRRARALQFD
jgi:choline kinase